MSYLIEPRPHGGADRPHRYEHEATIVLVGCGGTGAFLADAIGRLLIGRAARLFLVDHDRVEAHNTMRQAFERREVGRFKAEVLAGRLARRYGREVGYSTIPYDPDTHAALFGEGPSALSLLVGAVDNAAARRALATTLARPAWYGGYGRPPARVWLLDCGNARNSGQLLLGNAADPEALRGAFSPATGRCTALPAPHLQRPDLLVNPPEPAPRPAPDCAEAIIAGDQGPTVNQVVAALAAGYVEKLLAGTCGWMASYFDLDDGTLRCVAAEPRAVAALVGLHPNTVAPPNRRD